MVKTASPAMDLYQLSAITQEELDEANENFEISGLPYRIVRLRTE